MPNFKEIYNKGTITDRQTVLTFGKYKGSTIEFIVEHDPQYLLFCQSSIDWFDLHHSILDEIDSTEDERYRKNFLHGMEYGKDF